MKFAGIFLVIAGASSFIFHAMNMQSKIMGVFGEHEKMAAGIAIGLGAVLFVLGLRKKKPEKK
ncbi:MAG TPA: hypothetical protein VJB14_14110 [Planctomycetota bacterium]|nr:hypothetical protein [Planctomycetota bacterium]